MFDKTSFWLSFETSCRKMSWKVGFSEIIGKIFENQLLGRLQVF